MPTPPKVTPEIEAHILAQAAAGKSTRWIARWLSQKHKITISDVAVWKILRETRRARADAAASTVRGELQTKLPRDLQIFDERIGHLVAALEKVEAELGKLRGARSPAFAKLARLHKSLLEAHRKCLDTKLHYVGADQPDERNSFDGLAGLVGLGFAAKKRG